MENLFLLKITTDGGDLNAHTNASIEVGKFGPFTKQEFEERSHALVNHFLGMGWQVINVTAQFIVGGPMPIMLADVTKAMPNIRISVELFTKPEFGEIAHALMSSLKVGPYSDSRSRLG